MQSHPRCFSHKTPARQEAALRLRKFYSSFIIPLVAAFGVAIDAQAQLDPTTPKPKMTEEIISQDPHSAHSGAELAVPEDGSLTAGVYLNKYFGLTLALPQNWIEDLQGPPPSPTGHYSLIALKPRGVFNATLTIDAQDMFFSLRPLNNSFEVLKDVKLSLNRTLKAESGPVEIKIANRPFVRFDYSGAGELHYAVLATDIRCHSVTFCITTRDPKILAGLVQDINNLKLSEGAAAPVCVKDFASAENIVHQVVPELAGPKFAKVPVRVVIGTDGRVKQVHVINAFPDQGKSVTAALMQWVFKPYKVNGKPVEVETGILFEFGVNVPKPMAIPKKQMAATP
jgi:hypothetical protein